MKIAHIITMALMTASFTACGVTATGAADICKESAAQLKEGKCETDSKICEEKVAAVKDFDAKKEYIVSIESCKATLEADSKKLTVDLKKVEENKDEAK